MRRAFLGLTSPFDAWQGYRGGSNVASFDWTALFAGGLDGGAWVPTPETAWVDNVGGTPTAVDAVATEITDLSGNDNHGLNGIATLRADGDVFYFEAADDVFATTDRPGMNGDFWCAVVIRIVAGDGDNGYINPVMGYNQTTQRCGIGLRTSGTRAARIQMRNGSTLFDENTNTLPLNENIILSGGYQNGDLYIQVDGVEVNRATITPAGGTFSRPIAFGSGRSTNERFYGGCFVFGTPSGEAKAAVLEECGRIAGKTLPPPFEVLATGPNTASVKFFDSQPGDINYWFATTGGQPSIPDLKAGTGAASAGNHTAQSVPTLFAGPEGLTAGTAYDMYYLRTRDGQDSIMGRFGFTTEAADSDPAVLSNPTFEIIDETTVRVSVDTTEPRGDLSVSVTDNATTPLDTEIEAGQDHTGAAATAARTVIVDTVGTQTIEFTGLPASPLYAHFFHRDPTDNPSNTISSGVFTPADVSKPIPTSLEISLDGPDGFVGSFNTDTNNGVADVVLTTSQTPPAVSDIQNGVGVAFHINDQAVTTTGPQAIAGTGLAPGTYWAHAIHTGGNGNPSDPLTSSNSITVV